LQLENERQAAHISLPIYEGLSSAFLCESYECVNDSWLAGVCNTTSRRTLFFSWGMDFNFATGSRARKSST